jgi:hypothetical protein
VGNAAKWEVCGPVAVNCPLLQVNCTGPIAFVSHTYVVKPKKLGFNKHTVRPADQRALKKVFALLPECKSVPGRCYHQTIP